MDHSKTVGDILSWSAVIATLVGWLPPIAAIASLIWTGVQLYDRFKNKDK